MKKIIVNGCLDFERIIPPFWCRQRPIDCTDEDNELFKICNSDPRRSWVLKAQIDIVFVHERVEYLVSLHPGFIINKCSNDAFVAMIPVLVHDLLWVTHPVDFRLCNDIFRDMLQCKKYVWSGIKISVPAFSRYYHAVVSMARRSYKNQPRERHEMYTRTGIVNIEKCYKGVEK